MDKAEAALSSEQAKAKPSSSWRTSWLWRWTKRIAFIVMLVLGVPLIAMLCYGPLASPEKCDVIVVPGAALKNGGAELSDALERRMITAVELYHQGYAPYLFVSGGGEGAWSEASAMARWAMERGVPAERIILDEAGLTTRATARNAARMMKARGMTRALAVSQWYHVARVRLALEQEDIDHSGSDCAHPTFLIREPYFTAREIAALYSYLFRLDE
ncbi:MAG: YdcF family protein [Planctomycetes bacterium]|nr:YdcF family protein [Planctomycetota bacterium]NUQ33742.1 YdcF family protein [Planctomycetaceae bacterium]